MKTVYVYIIVIGWVIIACGTHKTTTTTTTTAPSQMTTPTPMIIPTGVYPPGEKELAAIQSQHPNITQEQLNEGYLIYTQGACIQCHQAKNIYVYSGSEWKNILINMSEQARLNEAQKTAVYSYVVAIKATQPSGQ